MSFDSLFTISMKEVFMVINLLQPGPWLSKLAPTDLLIRWFVLKVVTNLQMTSCNCKSVHGVIKTLTTYIKIISRFLSIGWELTSWEFATSVLTFWVILLDVNNLTVKGHIFRKTFGQRPLMMSNNVVQRHNKLSPAYQHIL